MLILVNCQFVRSCIQSGNKVVDVYYGLEYHHASHSTLSPYVKRIITNLNNILGHQAIILHIKSNCLGENNQLFVEVRIYCISSVRSRWVSQFIIVYLYCREH